MTQRQPRIEAWKPPPGYERCNTHDGVHALLASGAHSQTTHLIALDARGRNGGRPTVCGLTRFDRRDPETRAIIQQADLPGWGLGGSGVYGPDVFQVACDACFDLAESGAGAYIEPPPEPELTGLARLAQLAERVRATRPGSSERVKALADWHQAAPLDVILDVVDAAVEARERTLQHEDLLGYLHLHLGFHHEKVLTTPQKELLADSVDAWAGRLHADDPDIEPTPMVRWWRGVATRCPLRSPHGAHALETDEWYCEGRSRFICEDCGSSPSSGLHRRQCLGEDSPAPGWRHGAGEPE